MKKFTQTLLWLALILGLNKANANHVLGSDGRFTYLNKDTFLLTLDIYKDCKGVSLSPIQVNVNGMGFSFNKSFTMTQISCGDITPVCKKSCSKCDRTNCNAYGYPNGANASCTFPYGIEKITFQDTFVFSSSLNSSFCKFRVEYSQCCRSGAITTCCAGEYFYNYMELNRCLVNSSPIYHKNPINITCVGNCMAMDLSASDTSDHDSLSYHIAPALTAYGSNCSYQGSYTYKYPLYYDGFPNTKNYIDSTCKGFMLDSINGILRCKPMQQQFVQVVVGVKEWRYDTTTKKRFNIGLTRRDFPLIIVANCTNKPPSLPGASQVGCAGDLICFRSIKSSDPDTKDTVRLTWNKAIAKGTFTPKFNGSKKQEFDFCWQTDSSDASATPYYFTVTATDDACPAATSYSRSYSIKVNKQPEATYTATSLACGNVRILSQPKNGANAYNNKEVYTWEIPFPNGKIIRDYAKSGYFDTLQKLSSDGKVKYRFSIEANGCTMSYIDSIYIDTFLRASLHWDSACKGNTTTIKASPINAIPPITYSWNGQSSQSDSISFQLANDTMIYFGITDSTNCTFNDSIYINALPTAKFTSLKNRYQYTFTPVIQTYKNYLWSFGDGDTSSQMIPSHAYTAKGKYTVKLEVTTSTGCKDIYIDSVKADSLPMVTWTWNNACKGYNSIFKASIAFGTAPIIYTWNGKKGSNLINFLLLRDTIIYLKVTDGSGFVFYDSMFIKAEASIKFTSVKNISNFIFTPDAQYYPNYYWQFGDGTTSTKVQPSHTYNQLGTFLVKLEVYSQNGCYAVYMDSVIVDSLPNVIITTNNYCIGKSTTIRATVNNGTPPFDYIWNGQTSSTDSISFMLTKDTMIYVQVKNNNGFKYDDSIFISAEPITAFQISNIGNYYTFTPQIKNYLSYFWNFGDGDTATQISPSHLYNANGAYITKLIVQSSKGCTDSSQQTISVISALHNFLDNSPIMLYPNPTGSYSILEYGNNEKNVVKIYDITGKELGNIIQKNTANNQTILYPPSRGIYIINISSASRNYTLKWIVE